MAEYRITLTNNDTGAEVVQSFVGEIFYKVEQRITTSVNPNYAAESMFLEVKKDEDKFLLIDILNFLKNNLTPSSSFKLELKSIFNEEQYYLLINYSLLKSVSFVEGNPSSLSYNEDVDSEPTRFYQLMLGGKT